MLIERDGSNSSLLFILFLLFLYDPRDSFVSCEEIKFSFGHLEGGDSGLNAADMEASVATLQSMTEHLNCDLVLLREKESDDGKIAEYLIREKMIEEDFCEVRYEVTYVIFSYSKVNWCDQMPSDNRCIQSLILVSMINVEL